MFCKNNYHSKKKYIVYILLYYFRMDTVHIGMQACSPHCKKKKIIK